MDYRCNDNWLLADFHVSSSPFPPIQYFLTCASVDAVIARAFDGLQRPQQVALVGGKWVLSYFEKNFAFFADKYCLGVIMVLHQTVHWNK